MLVFLARPRILRVFVTPLLRLFYVLSVTPDPREKIYLQLT